MKRRIYMNCGTNVQMYANESTASSNGNNCASGCGSCGGSSSAGPNLGATIATSVGSSVASIGGDVITNVLGQAVVVVYTSDNPDD